MTAKKKRGLLSWLGFAEEEENKASSDQNIEAQQDEAVEADEQAEVEQQTPEQTSTNDDIEAIEQDVEPEVEAAAELSQEDDAEQEESPQQAEALETDRVQEQVKPTESFFARLKRSLQRTKQNIGAGFFGLFKGKKIDDELFEELEEQLLIADVGMNTTVKIIDNLTEKASRQDLKDGEALYGLLKQEMADILADVEQPLEIDTSKTPYVILMVGVNGVGKTTTIGKL
ncbi:signal recognition particle receptor subunit alpha, partial [Pseudoalteromonas sp.]